MKMSSSYHNKQTNQLIAAVALLMLANGSLICSLPVQPDQTPNPNPRTESQQTLNLTKQQPNPFAPRPISYVFDSKQLSPHMQMRKLSPTSNNVTCNDGSHVGYYMRQNIHSKSWVIFLQGGGFCGTHESCQQRWRRSPHLMSSNYWPKTKSVEGILSSEPNQNPYLWNANHVYVPYCSSDSWTGLTPAAVPTASHYRNNDNEDFSSVDGRPQGHSGERSFSFMGSKIIERVLASLYDDLARELSLHEAKFVLLAGDSAGATGVILNLDKVKRFIDKRFEADKSQFNCTTNLTNETACDNSTASKQPPVVRGLADSGWFLDNEPYNQGTMMLGDFYLEDQFASSQQSEYPSHTASPQEADVGCDRSRCSPVQSIKQAMRYWNGQVPEDCAAAYATEPWRCYFGYRAHQTLKTPLFVVQWLYDEAQLLADNIIRPLTSGQWDYVNKLVSDLRSSFENVTALFAPSCFSHSLVTKPTWNQININGLKLPHVLNSWEEQSLLDTSTSDLQDQQRTITSLRHSTPVPTIMDEFSVIGQDGIIVARPTFDSLLVDASEVTSGGQPTSFLFPIQQDQPQPPPTNNAESSRAYRSAQVNGVNNQQIGANRLSKAARKRKRNNSANSNKNRQVRQRIQPSTSEQQSRQTSSSPSRELNDLASKANTLPSIDRSTASGDSTGRTPRDRTSTSAANTAGRLGRSTIVDDATLMQSNNVPDDNISTTFQVASNNNEPQRNVDNQSPYSTLTLNSLGGRGSAVSFQVPPFSIPHQIVHIQTPSISHQESFSRFRLIDSCGWPQCNRDCPNLSSDFSLGAAIQF